MANNIFIKPEYLQTLQAIFKEHSPQASVWAYGSRIQNDAHSGSDLDLAITSLDNSTMDISHLRESIRESNIPFRVDIFELSTLPQSFQDEITAHRIEIYPNFDGVCENGTSKRHSLGE